MKRSSAIQRTPLRTGSNRRAGQAVVEFALILPVFLLMLFGAIEFGRAYYTVHLLTNAAREGARTGALPDKVESDVQGAVNDFLNGAALSGSWTTTAVAQDSEGTARAGLVDSLEGDRVYVTVAHNFSVLSGSLLPGFSGTVQLRGRCVFRRE